MPHDEADPEDPLELIGMALPAPDDESVREMAACFVESFYGLGHTPASILELFQDPRYQGPHLAWRTLGPAEIERIVDAYKGLMRFRQEAVIHV